MNVTICHPFRILFNIAVITLEKKVIKSNKMARLIILIDLQN